MFQMLRASIVVSAVLFLAACGASKENPSFVAGGNPGSASTIAPAESYDVPETIDVAYLDRVLKRLEEVRSSVRRDVLANKAYTDSEQERFNAIFMEPALSFQSGIYRDLSVIGEERLLPNPGPSAYDKIEVVNATSTCVWLTTFLDDVKDAKPDVSTTGNELDVVIKKGDGDTAINPTSWKIAQFVPVSLEVVNAERACG